MSSVITSWLSRIFIGGILCSMALILAGDGPRREVVRFSCACLMIVLLLTPLKNCSFSNISLPIQDNTVELAVEQALQQANNYQYSAVSGTICDYIRQQAEQLGMTCDVRLNYDVDDENVFHIRTVTVSYDPSQQAILSQLQEKIIQDCGVAAQQICWIER